MTTLVAKPVFVFSVGAKRILFDVSSPIAKNLVDLATTDNLDFASHHCTTHGWRNEQIDTCCDHMVIAKAYIDCLMAEGWTIFTGSELTPGYVRDYLTGLPDNKVVGRRRSLGGCPVVRMLQAMTGEEDITVSPLSIAIYAFPNRFRHTDFTAYLVLRSDEGMYEHSEGSIRISDTGHILSSHDVVVSDIKHYLQEWIDRNGESSSYRYRNTLYSSERGWL